jgi:hypothetical protein
MLSQFAKMSTPNNIHKVRVPMLSQCAKLSTTNNLHKVRVPMLSQFAKISTPNNSSLPNTLWLKKEDEKRGCNFA